MNTYHVVIDDNMIQNIFQTNMSESMDLLSVKMLSYILLLGIFPSIIVYRSNINYRSFKRESLSKLKIILLSIISITALMFSFSAHYTSFFREHKPLRYYTNPTYWVYSIGKYIEMTTNNKDISLKHIAEDAKISVSTNRKKMIVIMVVGEAARADRFSLNGYEKETNPYLSHENILNFSNISSCGTTTAVSVPCMFSMFNQSDYSYKKGMSTENVLDVLHNTNEIEILWRDNNSDSKGVALRVPYEDYRTPENNPLCDDECRDEGMLVGLDNYIQQHKDKDILIVLHQMGNHGPAYYKRYPKEFEKFTPACQTNELESCTQEEISNAYNNAILYTDYFLSKVISFLQQYDATNETAMFYMSDHGESLGEHGIYLHGLPNFIAPEAQTHVAALSWFGKQNQHPIKKPNTNIGKQFSQDNLFHTLLGLFNVSTKIYNKEMDIFNTL